MSQPLNKKIIQSVVLLENSLGKLGTGFIVSKKIDGKSYVVFLATNKHMIKNTKSGMYAETLTFRMYLKEKKDSPVQIVTIKMLENGRSGNRIIEHPNPDIDVVLIIISDIVSNLIEILSFTHINDTLLLTREMIKEELIDVGEEVIILGYPAGIFSKVNYYPIAKGGIIASDPEDDLTLEIFDKETNKTKRVSGKMILVDANLLGGNSGGPVIVRPRWKAKRNEESGITVELGTGMPPYVLGINSSSIMIPDESSRIIRGDRLVPLESSSALNIVFSSEYIRELIEEGCGRLKRSRVKGVGS